MGGREIFDYISKKLNIGEGETTADGIFSLERVFCLGCCGIAPVVMVNDEFFGKCDLQMVDNILTKF
jgi:NADH-quinone oxidoreductase subunit E